MLPSKADKNWTPEKEVLYNLNGKYTITMTRTASVLLREYEVSMYDFTASYRNPLC